MMRVKLYIDLKFAKEDAQGGEEGGRGGKRLEQRTPKVGHDDHKRIPLVLHLSR